MMFLYLMGSAYSLLSAETVAEAALDGSNLALFWLIYWFVVAGWSMLNLTVAVVRSFRFAVWGIR